MWIYPRLFTVPSQPTPVGQLFAVAVRANGFVPRYLLRYTWPGKNHVGVVTRLPPNRVYTYRNGGYILYSQSSVYTGANIPFHGKIAGVRQIRE